MFNENIEETFINNISTKNINDSKNENIRNRSNTEFIYIDPRNEFKYKISKVINNMETYTFQYHDNNNIPHAIFQPNILYDIENIGLTNLEFIETTNNYDYNV
jgi:hypothetical protein